MLVAPAANPTHDHRKNNGNRQAFWQAGEARVWQRLPVQRSTSGGAQHLHDVLLGQALISKRVSIFCNPAVQLSCGIAGYDVYQVVEIPARLLLPSIRVGLVP